MGHAAVLLADRGVLLAGDMLSDILIPLLDPRTSTFWSPATARSPGAPEVAARFAADGAYLAALRRGGEPADTCWGKRT